MPVNSQSLSSQSHQPSDRRALLIQLTALFIFALLLRILYLKLAIDHLGFERFSLYAPDSRLYLLIGEHILSFHEQGSYGLYRVGPGYGLILAGIKLLFGSHLIGPILFNIVMGSLAPVFVYLLATQLFGSKSIALLSGAISTVSLTAVAAGCHILTDQPFFTFHIAALVCFVQGYNSGRRRWFLAAGLIAGFAAYIRPIGLVWPYIFIFLALVIPVSKSFSSRFDLVCKAGITGAVLLLIIWSWSARNYFMHGNFIYCTNGMLTVRSCLIAQVAQNTWNEGKNVIDYRTQWESEDGDRTAQFAGAYGKAEERVWHELKKNPQAVLHFYWSNLIENMSAPNYYVLGQIPQLKSFMSGLNIIMAKWLGVLLIILTLLGLALMRFLGHRLAFWVLGSTYFAFSAFLGASFWQGSRLHYPAEMAWSIVLAFGVVWAATTLKSLIRIKPVVVDGR